MNLITIFQWKIYHFDDRPIEGFLVLLKDENIPKSNSFHHQLGLSIPYCFRVNPRTRPFKDLVVLWKVFAEIKKKEIALFKSQVTQQELDWYLSTV